MQTLRLLPVARDRSAVGSEQDYVELADGHACYLLRVTSNGELTAEGATAERNHEILADVADVADVVALLRRQREQDSESWLLLTRHPALSLNGTTPLPITAIEPGAILAVHDSFWMISVLWTPTPGPAPAALAKKKCPVCGGDLERAPVVQCLCGRWSHLEKPEAPDDPDALNCFLEGGHCGSCGHAATLTPQVIPEPSPTLLENHEDPDDEFLAIPEAVSQ